MYIPAKTKKQALDELSEGTTTVKEVANKYDIDLKTLYRWMSEKLEGSNGGTVREVRKLKQENHDLKVLLAEFALEVESQKKN